MNANYIIVYSTFENGVLKEIELANNLVEMLQEFYDKYNYLENKPQKRNEKW